MYAQVEKTKENKSRAVANSVVQKKNNNREGGNTFVDNRIESIQHQNLLQMISKHNSIIQRKFSKVPVSTNVDGWVQNDPSSDHDCWIKGNWHLTVWLDSEDIHIAGASGSHAGTHYGYKDRVLQSRAGPKKKGDQAKLNSIAEAKAQYETAMGAVGHLYSSVIEAPVAHTPVPGFVYGGTMIPREDGLGYEDELVK